MHKESYLDIIIDHAGEVWSSIDIDKIGYDDFNPPTYGVKPDGWANTPEPTEEFRVGVVGYSSQKFDELDSKAYLYRILMAIRNHSALGKKLVIVSGLTNLGVPKLAYELAKEDFGCKTVGVACSKASEFECYPVDEKHIIGNHWGDESGYFLSHIDALVRIGGGKQSLYETKLFKQIYPEKLVIEIDI